MTMLRNLFNKPTRVEPAEKSILVPRPTSDTSVRALDLAPNDPLAAYLQSVNGAVDVSNLNFDSPALNALKQSSAKMVVPLVSQGELVGLLSLGPRLSEQDYTTDDRGLLNNLASQAGPAVRVAQLVRQQQAEAREKQKLEQELQVARLIQQTLLPKQLPQLPGWHVAAHYQPARAVGGDFYDFLELPDGRLVMVIGDVTDKGVPAALVMATTRSILRDSARRELSPGAALERTNNLLCPDIPPAMFVTCLFAILDPQTGKLLYANAGHDLPYRRGGGMVEELRATGMPLGLMPDMQYEEKETTLHPGDSLLLYTDGLVEAHNPQREMFGFPRLQKLIGSNRDGSNGLIGFLLDELKDFTGVGWEQEDDVTLVMLQRTPAVIQAGVGVRTLAEFIVPSEAGNERLAMKQVADAVQASGLPNARLEKLKTAVAEATMNAIEHGNQNRTELPVRIQVFASESALSVRISDKGGSGEIRETQTPDLEAKLAGLQSPRGWGLFLIKNLVDEMNVTTDAEHHTVELVMNLKGESNG